MAPFGLQFAVTGEKEVEHRMLGIGTRAADAGPVLRQIADDMRAMEKRLFDGEGLGTWPPLQDSTIEKKRRENLDPRILHATLALRDSLTKENRGGFEIVTDTSLHFGSSVDWAQWHKSGTRHMPKRDPLPVKTTDRKRWTKMIQRFIVEADRAAYGVGTYGMGLTSPFGP